MSMLFDTIKHRSEVVDRTFLRSPWEATEGQGAQVSALWDPGEQQQTKLSWLPDHCSLYNTLI